MNAAALRTTSSLMIDIHSHILWGIDDGPKTLDDSLAMLRAAAAAGTTDIVATPHANSVYTFQPEIIRSRIAELRERHQGPPRVHVGCDFHLSMLNIEDALLNPTKYTVNAGRYLLVELPEMFSPDSIGRALDYLSNAEIIPVITHPERNSVLQRSPEIMDEWINQGCFIQLTAQSLLGRFGQLSKRSALSCLRKGRAHFVASDAHDVRDRPPRLDIVTDLLRKEVGELLTHRLLSDHPLAVIQDREDFVDVSHRPKLNVWRIWRR
jgi:protein-tyrosine phosphatase